MNGEKPKTPFTADTIYFFFFFPPQTHTPCRGCEIGSIYTFTRPYIYCLMTQCSAYSLSSETAAGNRRTLALKNATADVLRLLSHNSLLGELVVFCHCVKLGEEKEVAPSGFWARVLLLGNASRSPCSDLLVGEGD
jgi:hypothetical protein